MRLSVRIEQKINKSNKIKNQQKEIGLSDFQFFRFIEELERKN